MELQPPFLETSCYPSKRANYLECAVLNGGRPVLFQRHHGAHMAAWHKGHPLHVSPNGKLPN